MKLQDYKKQLLKSRKFKEEYNKYDLAFEISQMLIEARIIKGITQEKLAKMIGTRQSGIARAENGSYLPSLTFLDGIARAFKTNLIVRFGFMEQEQIINTSQNTNSRSLESTALMKPSQGGGHDLLQPFYQVNLRSNSYSCYLGGS